MFVCLTIEGLSCGCFADVDGPESDIGGSSCSDLESLGDGLSLECLGPLWGLKVRRNLRVGLPCRLNV